MSKFEKPDVKVLPPDTRLRDKIGKHVKLEDIFNSEKIALAQQAIDEARDDFLSRARLFMDELHHCFNNDVCDEKKLARLSLTLKAQAGTFGYYLASDVAQRLYHFVHQRKVTESQKIVVKKHLEALDYIFQHTLVGEGGEQGEHLRQELDKLTIKFSD